jgi:DNA-binding NtrC family response regulator
MAKDYSIIVIDDEAEVCGLLKDLLTSEGYRVSAATDPQKGLQMVLKQEPDAVLLDLGMPKMDGFQVLKEIKKSNEALPVIIITGFVNIGLAREAIRLGAFDYVTKPFDVAYIKALVKNALDQAP